MLLRKTVLLFFLWVRLGKIALPGYVLPENFGGVFQNVGAFFLRLPEFLIR
jgi:hypothetical protein